MRLPTTYKQAENELLKAQSIAFARGFLQAKKRAPGPGQQALAPEISWFDRDDGAWWTKRLLKDAAREPLQAELVCTYAREGWGLAQDAVEEVLTEAQQHGEQLSASLTAYDIAHRQGLIRCGGPERGKTFLRNIVIYDIVEAMRERFGLCPTRSRSARPGKERLSGCYVAYLALKEERDALSEPAVERIWAEYEPIFRSPMWRSIFLSATAFTISST